jgi:hypothetical protein
VTQLFSKLKSRWRERFLKCFGNSNNNNNTNGTPPNDGDDEDRGSKNLIAARVFIFDGLS